MWYDIVTNWRTLIVVGLGIVSAAAFWKIISAPDTPPAAAPAAKLADNKSTSDTAPASKLPKASIMSAPATNLNPPKVCTAPAEHPSWPCLKRGCRPSL